MHEKKCMKLFCKDITISPKAKYCKKHGIEAKQVYANPDSISTYVKNNRKPELKLCNTENSDSPKRYL